ncbi:hypothetical protein Tco_1051340 [Tanacetum coccineum]
MTVRAQPAMSPGLSTRVTEAMALSDSAFCKRYRSSYETPSPSPSPTLLVWKRYKGTSELILDTDSEGDKLGDEDTNESKEDESLDADDEREKERERLDDKGHGLDDEGYGLDDEGHGLDDEDYGLEDEGLRLEEEAVLEEQQGAERVYAFRQPTLDTWVDAKDGRVYTDIPAYVPLAAPIQTLPSPKWLSGSLPISSSSPVVPSPIASLVATPTATISVDEDQFIEVGAQLELHGSILHDHI